jgi:hypothetical protein
LGKLVYTPVVAIAIKDLAARLTANPLVVEGDQWVSIRENLDGQGTPEDTWIPALASDLLWWGTLYVAAYTPAAVTPPRSLWEAEALQPYGVVYDPRHITNWGDGWYRSQVVHTAEAPDGDRRMAITWTTWTTEATYTHTAPARQSRSGTLQVLTDAGWVNLDNPKARVPEGPRWDHGLGRPTLVRVQLPTESWAGNNLYSKQLQYTVIESGWTDTGSVAGQIQRLYTPPDATPMGDPRVAYTPADLADVKAGNPYILIGADYKVVETTGAALSGLGDQLKAIEEQIKAIAAMSFASGPKSGLVQSEGSKAMDQANLNDTMQVYGRYIRRAYQDLLDLMALITKRPPAVVRGLDNYSSDSLGELVALTNDLGPSLASIPNTAKKLWMARLVRAMVGDPSEGDQAAIDQELEDLYSGQDDLTALADALGIPVEDIEAALGGQEAA